MDENDHNEMDLALDGDFDEALFDCWDAAVEQEQNNDSDVNRGAASDRLNHGTLDRGVLNVSNGLGFNHGMQHGANGSSNPTMFPSPSDGNSTSTQSHAPQGATVSVSSVASSSVPSFQQLLSGFADLPLPHQRSLDPRAILSSAICPPHGGGSATAASSSSGHDSMPMSGLTLSHDGSTALESQQQQQSLIAAQQQQQTQFDLTSAAFLPLAMNALAAGVTLPLPLILQAAQQAQQAIHQTQSPSLRQDRTNQQFQNTQHQVLFPAPDQRQEHAYGTDSHAFAKPAGLPPLPIATQAINPLNAPAPVYHYDAAAELRANFLNSQLGSGAAAPLMTDPNHPYHFGIAVNGFHPQSNVGFAQPLLANLSQIRKNNTKNVQEQRRAQKITDLIENLRMKMEKDGWQVGLNKSKLNTLSWYDYC
jgi:hypothetical protein